VLHLGDEPIKLTKEKADLLVAKLGALAQAARVFGSGVAEVDVSVGWSLRGEAEPATWTTDERGQARVRMQLDLSRMIDLLQTSDSDWERTYVDAFKAGFLHELGHLLYSPEGGHAWEKADASWGDELDHQPDMRRLLRQIRYTLEDARIERRLTQTFRGAQRYLEGHPDQALQVAMGNTAAPKSLVPGMMMPSDMGADYVARLVATLFLQIWGREHLLPRKDLPPQILDAADRLRASLAAAGAVEDADPVGLEERDALTEWVVTQLLPEVALLIELTAGTEDDQTEGADSATSDYAPEGGITRAAEDGQRQEGNGESAAPDEQTANEQTRGGNEPQNGDRRKGDNAGPSGDATGEETDELDETEAGTKMRLGALTRQIEDELKAPSLLKGGRKALSLDDTARVLELSATESHIILYPHVDGSMVVDELPVAHARLVPPTERVRCVLDEVLTSYGPLALDAFAAESDALQRAFQVNFERRYDGRYRTGRRVGVANMRRFVVSQDLRLFERIQVPDRLSYYFHLLVDVSPSMLTHSNAQKAIAVGYAFAEALDRLRVPVDVSLYSTAITELYDHRRDTLDRYFGGDFGYLSSGTHEIEAIAWARQKAERVAEERKIVVVVTDGHPNAVALHRAGSTDLRAYYQGTLLPWLRAANIDLLAIGIGTSPTYHAHSVTISSGWESIGVFLRLLDDIIARGRRSHEALWR
jgi:Cobalamin biosynthesis protein CobT VWA domain